MDPSWQIVQGILRSWASRYRSFTGAYEKPSYVFKNISGTADNPIDSVIMHDGRRWIIVNMAQSKIQEPLFQINEVDAIHTFWHIDRLDNFSYYSTPNTKLIPTGFVWKHILPSSSKGAGSPYGAVEDINAKFECQPALISSNIPDDFCGKFGFANFTTMQCDCIAGFGGYHCEFAPDGTYVREQSVAYLNFPESYERNTYHLRYWSQYSDEELTDILLSFPSLVSNLSAHRRLELRWDAEEKTRERRDEM